MRLLSDSELFIEQTTWFAPHLPQPTIGEFACWIAPWLRDCSKQALEALYRINHPAQHAAESALVDLLEAAPKRAVQAPTVGENCGRNVDWASTLALAHPFSPTRFLHPCSAAELDAGVLAGLATIARQWSYLLTAYGGYGEIHPRVARLRATARPFGYGRLTLAHLRKLARAPQLGGRVAALRVALELMSAPLNTPQAGTALSQLCSQLMQLGREGLENQDDALEVSVVLCIARAATGLGWSITRANASATRRKPRLQLAKGKLRCTIAKGVFEYPAEPKRRAFDALAMLERKALGLASTGRQPDVVISFWNVEEPKNVLFCIADAKRNASGDGVAYLKKSVTAMTAYMVAFAEPLRVRLSPESGGFAAPLMPAATLFLQQGAVDLPAGGTDDERAWLTARDAHQYACVNGVGWASEALECWFQGIAGSAQALLHS